MDKKHIDLLLSVSELDWVVAEGNGSESLLGKIVSLVSRHMKSDVCSIYIFEEASQTLVLKATEGLPRTAVDTVTLNSGRGLSGNH